MTITETKYKIAIEALQKIADPISWIQKKAKIEKANISDDVIESLVKDPSYAKGVAKKVLADLEEGA